MQYLNQYLDVKGHRIANRLVMPPMATARADENGQVTEKVLDYYSEKTRGGYIGLVITEHSFVSPEGMANRSQMSVACDGDIPCLKQLVDSIHANRSLAIAQISHAGASSRYRETGVNSVGASPVQLRWMPMPDHELTAEEIQLLVQKFADGARRCTEAGFDGVELHAAHGYLLNQFYSPLSNKREDAYGGDLLGRLRFLLEVVQAVREAIGEERLLLVRLGAVDDCEGGNTIEDAVAAAKALEKAGVDILDISGGMTGVRLADEQGYFVPETARLKQEIAIPIIMTGGITDPAAAEAILREGKADLIGVGRAILKDSDWAKLALTME